MKNIAFLFLLLPYFSLSIFSQDAQEIKDEERFTSVYPQEKYLADLDEFAKSLTETHPQAYEFMSKEDFWKSVSEKKNSISSKTTLSEFIWMCSELIANLGCSHSNLGFFNQEFHLLPDSLRFPIDSRFIGESCFITDPLVNADRVSIGEEIISINGLSIAEIKAGIFKHISSDGYNPQRKKGMLNVEFNSYLSYFLGFPASYSIVLKGKKAPIQLRALKKYNFNPRNAYDSGCKDRLCAEISEKENTAQLTIRSFYFGDKVQAYYSFIDSVFEVMNTKQIQHLIVDVRGNGGGPSFTASHLLKYLAEKPFTYFSKETRYEEAFNLPMEPYENAYKGKIYVLMDEGCGSTTGHFLSLLEDQQIGTLVGTESGSTFSCNDNSQNFKLTHTGISYRVARNTFTTTAQGLAKNRGILPDHPVEQTLKDFLNNRDTALEFTQALIKEGRD
ncbi:MAG: S41 family peptidase [Bacteroidia bacterium]|nr:S41 family peptidase [Bacteroidia bacterium]